MRCVSSEEIVIVFKRLSVFVQLIAWRMPDIFDGRSPEDLPSEVLIDFLTSTTSLGWDPAKGPLDRFLMGVLMHKRSDHSRRQRRIIGSIDDPNFLQQITRAGKNRLLQMPELSRSEPSAFRARLFHAVNGDPELVELVNAIENADDLRNLNQKLADTLHTTPRDIVNRKRRIARKFPRNGHLL